jgi:hypothetical protein
VAEALVRDLVAQVRHTQRAEDQMRRLLTDAYAALPASAHLQVVTIPGIGTATAAVLIAQTIDIKRFATPEHLVGYFGVFPEENTSGVDKYGKPVPPGTMRMSHKGNDLVRGYLWNAARVAIVHNPAIRALYRRLRAKGKRGDVALGHCMRKLLHLVFAVWKTNRPFDDQHFPWEPPSDTPVSTPPATTAAKAAATQSNDKAVGHKADTAAEKVVTTADSSVKPVPAPVNPPSAPTPSAARPQVDFAFLRQQVTMEQVLRHLGLFEQLRGRGLQRRGCCPVHGQPGQGQKTFSVHLGKQVFQCFEASCAVSGNVLDLWAAVRRLPLYEAAQDLAATFHLPRNREEEPVR